MRKPVGLTAPYRGEWTPKIERHYKDGELVSQTIQYTPQGEKHPYPHKWVGLTDEEIQHLQDNYDVADFDYARAIEAKLKEKNT